MKYSSVYLVETLPKPLISWQVTFTYLFSLFLIKTDTVNTTM